MSVALAERIAAAHGLKKRGDRYVGCCPDCGGSKKSDKFVIRTDNGFSYRCYAGCGLQGDDIKWLRDKEGMTCPEAHQEAAKPCENPSCPVRETCRMGDGKPGQSRGRRRPARLEDRHKRKQQPATIPVQQVTMPSHLWKDWAMSLVEKGAAALAKEPDIIAYLEKRGITTAAADRYRLGWLGHDRRVKYTDIGLPIPEGKKERMWVPGGLIIPIFDRDGQIYRIRIRRTAEAMAKFLPNLKYMWIKGSGAGGPLIIRPNDMPAHAVPGVVIVEAELDAYAIAAVCPSVIVVALGSVSIGLPEKLLNEFRQAPVILVAFDADEDTETKAGQNAAIKWIATFPRAKYWPVPTGKDPGEYAEQGGDLDEWIRAGLPYPPPSPRPAAHEHLSSPDCNTDGVAGQKESLIAGIITLLDGREVYLTDDQVTWQRLADEGKLVLSGGEIARLKTASAGMSEEERCMFMGKMLDIKEVFGGGYVARGESF